MRALRRFLSAIRYLRHPGGTTHRSRLSKAKAEERKREMTEQLRREVAAAEIERGVAALLAAEGLK